VIDPITKERQSAEAANRCLHGYTAELKRRVERNEITPTEAAHRLRAYGQGLMHAITVALRPDWATILARSLALRLTDIMPEWRTCVDGEWTNFSGNAYLTEGNADAQTKAD
jgi:hypothetical protein